MSRNRNERAGSETEPAAERRDGALKTAIQDGEQTAVLTVESLTTIYHNGQKRGKGQRWEISPGEAAGLVAVGAVRVIE